MCTGAGKYFLAPIFFVKGTNYMSLIKAENLTFAYPSSFDNIFENVSFQIDTDWKLGFVGRNGRGKTTFLKLLMGEYEYSGKIVSDVQFDYFPYEVKNENSLAEDVLLEVCPLAEEWEFMRELSILDVDCEVLLRPFNTLSNGERTKALLAALFLNEGHFLLIDEPTNHLDLKARETVSAYLKKKKGFILVSHDRYFLDGSVDHILSINKADIEIQKGSFSSYLENKARNDSFETACNEKLKKEISRLSAAAKRSADWSDKTEKSKKGTRNSGLRPDRGFIGHKAEKMMKRSKAIEERKLQAAEEKSALMKNVEKTERLKLQPLFPKSDAVLSVSNLNLYYGEKSVCGPLSFCVKQGQRFALDGKNGSGKSSILKLLAGEDITHTGELSIPSGIIISYVPQDCSFLQGSLSDFAHKNEIDETLFKTILRKFGFERTQFEKNMESFSQGQKKKVLLAGSLCKKAHLYIWDEPLNYIDIYSRMQIERLIEEFCPTMIFVEHDKSFRQKIATDIICV